MNENKFSGMGSIYSKYRPSYPAEFIDYLKNDAGLSEDKIIADVGSGTGILTKQLIMENNTVYAVEPNDDMRAVAECDLSSYKNFISVNGTAENTTLSNSCVDFITVAQAFHWFDGAKFKEECRRILKPGGKVVLVWNSRDGKSSLVVENDEINRKYCPNFKGFSGAMRGAENESDFDHFFNGNYEIRVFKNNLKFDEQGFIGRNLSASYAPKETDGNYSSYVSELKALFDRYAENGVVTMSNLTRSYVGSVV
ncbi:MAG: class I SAM-dependent methyltransferase [Oscillospiraceae bacterium]|jgi:SAM-dependent methyltransferase|nr:class I SAM-dependent methyltransferase [Oscillospiraceae bacterium]